MKLHVCKRQAFTSIPKCAWIFLFFILFILTVFIMNILEFQNKVKTISIFSRPAAVAPSTYMHYDFCKLKPLSPKEAREEDLLLESVAWPDTPPLPFPLSLEKTSDPGHSTFTILPKRGGGQWRIGDKLEVMINMKDFQGRPKKFGGDVLLARLHSPTIGAGVAGKVVDHLNGSYTAVFLLLWKGSAQVQKPLCNYTHLCTGEPWFCYKPDHLSCDARINYFNGGYQQHITTMEKLFQSGVNLKVSIPASGPSAITIFPEIKGQSEENSSSEEPGPSGYYYQDVWRALGGTTIRQFNTSSAITQCLKGKVIHMYGDSTMRQWFEHLTATLPDLKEFDLHSEKQSGPFMALNYANNIMVKYRCHGPPLWSTPVPAIELHYIASELDNMVGGSRTVVVLGIWAHFATFPLEFYIRRMLSIRSAVVRLLSRAPDTLVVIRTGNPKSLTCFLHSSTNSDWYTLQQLKVLKAMFKGLNVHLVNAWEMVIAHHLPQELHPQPPIIKNTINFLLSYICPEKGG